MVYFLSNEDVAQRITVEDSLSALENAYREWDAGRATVRPKTNVYVFDDDERTRYNYVSMEGAIQKLGIFAIRMRSDMYDQAVWVSGTRLQKRASVVGKYCGLILFFSSKTAEPIAIANDGHIMHLMVGGLAGIAAKYMAREDSSTLCLIGSQWMAKGHAEAICKVRDIRTIKVYSPTPEHRLEFAQEMSKKLGLKVEAEESAEKAVRGSDIVAVCTNSLKPVISGDWLEPGMHLSCVQTLELGCVYPDQPGGEDVLRSVDYKVSNMKKRNWEETLSMAGRPLVPDAGRGEGLGFVKLIQADTPRLTDVIDGRVPGRYNDRQITFFVNNDGNGLCFAALGEVVLRRIRERGDIGLKQVPLEWFLQDIPD